VTSPGTADLDQLLGASVEAAVQLLAKDGEFYPFALALTAEGEVVAPSVEPDTDHPSAAEVEELLVQALRGKRADLRAACVCSDVRIRSDAGEERDAIRIELESPQAEPLVVMVPYADQQLDEPFGLPGERRVFA
jgi:hypothetical protein